MFWNTLVQEVLPDLVRWNIPDRLVYLLNILDVGCVVADGLLWLLGRALAEVLDREVDDVLGLLGQDRLAVLLDDFWVLRRNLNLLGTVDSLLHNLRRVGWDFISPLVLLQLHFKTQYVSLKQMTEKDVRLALYPPVAFSNALDFYGEIDFLLEKWPSLAGLLISASLKNELLLTEN